MAVYLPLEQCQRILDQMERTGIKYWWIEDTDKTEIASNENDTGTIEDSFNSLMENLNDLTGDYAIVTIRKTLPNRGPDGEYKKGGNTTSGRYIYRVRLKPAPGSSRSGMNGFGGGGIGMEMVMGLYQNIANLTAKVETQPLQARIAELEKEVKEGKKETGVEGLFGMAIDKFMQAYKAGEFGNTPIAPVAGVETKTAPVAEKPLTEEEKKDKGKVLGKAIKDVGAVLGDDTFAFMTDLAERAKTNPELFKMFAKASVDKELNLADLIKKKVA